MSAVARLPRAALPLRAVARPVTRAGAFPRALPVLPALRVPLSRPLSTPTALGLRAAPRASPLRVRLGQRRFNSSSSANAAPERPRSAYERFKELTKTYGSYAIIMYLALSAVDFSLSLLVVHSVGAEHIEPAVAKITRLYRVARHGEAGADALERADVAKKAADDAEAAADQALGRSGWWTNKTLWAEITLAYAIHKVGLLPVRAALTVAWTPKVVSFLRARGWIGAAGAKRAAQHGAGKMRAAVDAAKDRVK